MSQPRKRNRAADRKQALIKTLRSLALAATPDEASEELYDHVEQMVEAGLDADVEAVIDDPTLSDAASEAIGAALEEAGYRLSVLLQAKGAAEPELGVIIPFALTFLMMVPETQVARLPADLPDTIDEITRSKWLRQALGVDDQVSLFVDGHLYRLDHSEWQSASAVRRYLHSIAAYFSQKPPPRPPLLARDYARPVQFEKTPDMGEGAVVLVERVLCGGVMVDEGEAASTVEERLFETESAPPLDLGPFIQAELNGQNLADAHVIGLCTPIELWDVPREGLTLRRLVGLKDRAEKARSSLASRPSGGVPLWRLDVQPSSGGQAVTVRAFTSRAASERPLFTYTWEVVETVEDIEDVLEDFRAVAKEYGARLLMPGEFAPGQAGWRALN